MKVRIPQVLTISALAVGAALFVVWYVRSPTDTALVDVKIPQFSRVAAKGRSAYEKTCAACHGKNGAGSDQGPPLVHDIYNPGHHGDASFFFAAKRGVPRHHWSFGDMPPQPQVSDDEMAAIVRYVRELQRANGIFYRPHRM